MGGRCAMDSFGRGRDRLAARQPSRRSGRNGHLLLSTFIAQMHVPRIFNVPSQALEQHPASCLAATAGRAPVGPGTLQCTRRATFALVPLLIRGWESPAGAAEIESWMQPLELDRLLYVRELGKGGYKTVFEVKDLGDPGGRTLAVGAEKLMGKQRVRDAIATLEVARYIRENASPDEAALLESLEGAAFIRRPLDDFAAGSPLLSDPARAVVSPPSGSFLGGLWMVHPYPGPGSLQLRARLAEFLVAKAPPSGIAAGFCAPCVRN